MDTLKKLDTLKTIESPVTLPLVVELGEVNKTEFISFYFQNKTFIERSLSEAGAIKFRGVSLETIEDFKSTVNSLSEKFMPYTDGNSPRTKLTDNIYTSTEYDKSQRITMHNELSYSAKWPNWIFFTCLQPAETGGETLLADGREILTVMHPDIVEEIKAKRVTYIRNLHGGRGMGPSWQDTFETNDKTKVDQFCKSNGIKCQWLKDGMLRILHTRKGIIEHRINGQRVWFNQIDQFHPSHLGKETFEALQLIYDSAETFPMYVKFGDGTQISEAMVSEILRTIESVTYAPAWNRNELLMVDNELVTHGRNWYTGDRKVLVSMSA